MFQKAVVREKATGLVVYTTKECTEHFENIFGEIVIRVGVMQKMYYSMKDYWVDFYSLPNR